MAVRRELLRRLGGFRADLGMSGARQGYGEETELQERLRGYTPRARLLYCPRMAIDHAIWGEKLTLRWRLRKCWRHGVQAGSIYNASSFCAGPCPRWGSLLLLVGHLGLLLWRAALLPLRGRSRWPHWQTYLLVRVLPHLYSVVAYASFLARGGAGRRGR
jgi:GT2 family glycosyltransferase